MDEMLPGASRDVTRAAAVGEGSRTKRCVVGDHIPVLDKPDLSCCRYCCVTFGCCIVARRLVDCMTVVARRLVIALLRDVWLLHAVLWQDVWYKMFGARRRSEDALQAILNSVFESDLCVCFSHHDLAKNRPSGLCLFVLIVHFCDNHNN